MQGKTRHHAGTTRKLLTFLVVPLLALTFAQTVAGADPVPGERSAEEAAAAPPEFSITSLTSLTQYRQIVGKVVLSEDACGTNAASCTVDINKPSASATVREAHLFCATTGLSGYVPQNDDVTLNGSAVIWDQIITSSINSSNAVDDVTAIVAPVGNAAGPGLVSFTIAENPTLSYDGCILKVIWDDPTTTTNSILIYFGAQQTTGDTFTINFSQPLDAASFLAPLEFSLGISFGHQPGSQFSQVDVNGDARPAARLTTSAGGEDDGVGQNGALITVGGTGDTTANPPPFAPAITPSNPDDELYDLRDFLQVGDTSMTVATLNPSNDDNIFIANFFLRGVTVAPPQEPDSLDPPVVTVTLQAGESTTVDKTLHLNGLPAAADIIVAIDTTSSMGDALIDAKADANQICLDVQAEIPGARFAAVEFQDYPIDPYGAATDDPYELRTTYTADCAAFSAAVGLMALGNGLDLPESNNRVHFEAYSDATLLASRDADATRFLVVLADNVPHGVAAFEDCPSTDPYSDPGRNGVNESGAGDDIETLEALDGLDLDNTTLLYISYNSGTVANPCHVDMAEETGGVAVPDDQAADIGAFIITNAALVPYTVDLQISAGCEIGFSFDPAPPYGPFTGEQTIEFVETITAPTAVGTYTCTITAVMTPGGPTTAVETVTVTVVPGDPFRLVLTPATDTNTVDDQHCVTATVTDRFGNPTPGITVDFSVSPTTFRTPSSGPVVTNDSGQATFCYTSALPGADIITATARGGTNPSDTARKTWILPASTAGCKVTDGGRITAANGDKATFGSVAKVSASGTPSGAQEYQDHGPIANLNVHSTAVLAVRCSGNTASVFGTATINGSGSFDYRIDLTDNREPGVGADTYRIRLSTGYDSGLQILIGGNIQMH